MTGGTRASAFGIVAAALIAAPAAARAIPNPPASADIPGAAETYRLLPDALRLTLPVAIGAGGPYRFVVDTGAERTVISSALAGALALAPGAPLRILTLAGGTQVQTALIPSLRLSSSRALRDVQAPVLAAADIGADGMLGIDALHGRTVVFDFAGHAMTITAAIDRDRHDPDEIVVTARTRHGRLVLGDARVEHLPTAIILDTGAELTVGNHALRDALVAHRKLGPVARGSITTIAGETLIVEMVAVRALDIGGLSFRQMPIAFIESPVFTLLGLDGKPALLLGMDALRLFNRVTVDFGSRHVKFLR